MRLLKREGAIAPCPPEDPSPQIFRMMSGRSSSPPFPRPSPADAPSLPSARAPERDLLYVLRGGCAWRLLPHDFLPWQTACHYYSRVWRMDGTWEHTHAHTVLRERLRRLWG
jgi:transposase